MSRQRTRNTTPEKALRSALHQRGFRFRLHARPLETLRREADLVFRGARVAVFVDGCFWHGCPEHRTHPKRNAVFWSEKIEKNRRRDAETDELLSEAGWSSIRVWEHETTDEAVAKIAQALKRRVKP